ncbi:seed linoleate 9S-lipoxygenase-like [Vigna umbellata]|uniref:seed linoleate 9S-lipoxygenase-like n=1 Tax=Vigna umbellata TaxID=87088 RepID=UPI001F5EDBC9|nr:seed linoleate 9S-lipoxygenase-like [Vigna umbellata]
MSSIVEKKKLVKGRVVLIRKSVVQTISSVQGLVATGIKIINDSPELDITKSVSFKLISRNKSENARNLAGKVGKDAYLENNVSVLRTLKETREEFDIYFEWDDKDMGTPGAFYVTNKMNEEFFLVSVTIEYPSEHDQNHIHFDCNSWIHNHKCYKTDRIFFANIPYLPGKTPEQLKAYREEELKNLRGDGKGKREKWDRIYDYDVYNDLGFLDSDGQQDHPVLGGLKYPYPRRVRTGRNVIHNNKNGGNYEEQAEVYYVPRDENFSDEKTAEFFQLSKKALGGSVQPLLLSLYLKTTSNEFNGFEEVLKMYEGGVNLPLSITGNGNPSALDFPTPDVIKESKFAWMTDEEFAREMIAGVNPLVIRLAKKDDLVLPWKQQLCNCIQPSTVTKEILEKNIDEMTLDEAFHKKRLFILDYYDAFMPYLTKINNLPSAKAYATRTFLFLQDDGTLKPLCIELSKPHKCPCCGNENVETTVVLPEDKGVEGTIWLLAKAHVVVNDTNYHQLISHWLHTHAVIEPFAISTNRNLSVLHPIYKLLHPHFRDTFNINSLARKSLISAGSIIEQTFLPGPYSMVMSSAIYKNWVFADQALPKDLIKRGLAFEDDANDLKLVIEDYPYAVDGLEIWNATKLWVQDYVALYYSDDQAIQGDDELQEWWKEVVEKGHGDLKAQWSKMHTSHDLVETCTTIIWIASALHAAVNFGQYPYGGYIINRPTQSRRWIPKAGTQEYDEMTKNPQEAYLKTITPKYQSVVDLSVMELLSTHASDEVYLGQRNSLDWTAHQEAKDLFRRFTDDLRKIENEISDRNSNEGLKNRTGPVKMPYTVLLPTSKPGMTFRGIPNSVSI